MAANAETLRTFNAVGIREDLEDTIYRLDYSDMPLSDAIGKTKMDGTLHEWQVEEIRAGVTTNSNLEGDVATINAAHKPARIGVYAQIFRETGSVSRTQEKSNRAGIESTLDEQKLKKGIALRRDIEATISSGLSSRAESGATTRRTAGILAWVTDNKSRGVGGSNGGWSSGGVVASPTNGTQRTFTEAQVKSVIADGFNNGATFSLALMAFKHKQEFGAFAGLAANRVNQEKNKQASIVAAAELYVSDNGNIALKPSKYFTRDCLLIDPEYFAVGTYDGMKTEMLGKTGDSTEFLITCEKGLISKNQRGAGVIADLT